MSLKAKKDKWWKGGGGLQKNLVCGHVIRINSVEKRGRKAL